MKKVCWKDYRFILNRFYTYSQNLLHGIYKIYMIKHNLLDIEGTTAPIAFVHQVLFPYAKEKMGKFLETYIVSDTMWEEIQTEFSKDSKTDDKKFLERFPKENSNQSYILEKKDLESYFLYLIESDRKFGPLKEVQGKIWKEGYESGTLKSILFPDTLSFLQKSKTLGIQNHVYSSGSVEAQVLIYQYSDQGDLRSYFSSYFDTAVGGKREVSSYINIASKLGADVNEICFFTDIVEEAEAAQAAGMEVVILDRPGNIPQKKHDFKVWKDFLNTNP